MPKETPSFDVIYRTTIATIQMGETDLDESPRSPEEHAINAIVRDNSEGTFEFEVPTSESSWDRSISYSVKVKRNARN